MRASRHTRHQRSSTWATCVCALLGASAALAAEGLQDSGLQLTRQIPIPGWTVANVNTDLFGFNPVTRTMYLADRTNHAITVIDTHSHAVVGMIPLSADTVVNQPLIPLDLQQLVVSDGLNSVLVWDLRAPAPSGTPQTFPMPSSAPMSGPDGMDYDPINHVVYVVTDNPPYLLVGISLTLKKIVSTTPLPYSADLIKFNSVDGKIYISMEDADHDNANAGLAVYDPTTEGLSTPASYRVGPICPGHGIDIDPVSNVAVVGCFGGTSDGNLAIDLGSGQHVTFADVGGTDSIVLNPNLRRFYSGSGLNKATTSGCPQTPNAPPFGSVTPVVGVFDAIHPEGGAPARLDGVACTGRGNHIAGTDPITNEVYVPVAQYPADPNSTKTGTAGVLVFHDHTRPAQPPVVLAHADLAPIGQGAASADVWVRAQGSRRLRLRAEVSGLTAATAWLVVPTTVGNEVVPCAVGPKGGTALCSDLLLGDPLVGGRITLSSDENAVARGRLDSSPPEQ